MARDLDWDDLKVFLAISQMGGLKKAARRLGIHHTSCARRLTRLETALGTKLFDRVAGGYRLNEGGKALLRSSTRIRDEFDRISLDMVGKDARLEGPVTLTLPYGFATHLLMPALVTFQDAYPDVHLTLNVTYAFTDLDKREADIAVRHVEEPPMSLTGRPVARLHASAYASRDYLAVHDPVGAPQDCHWLGWGSAERHLSWPQKGSFPKVPVRAGMYSDIAQLAAAEADMGIASLPCFLGDASKRLVRLPGANPEYTDTIWVLTHRNMASNARVRALMRCIADAFGKQANLIEGRMSAARERLVPE